MDTITDFISKKNHSINIQKYVVAGASKVHYILNLQDLQTAQMLVNAAMLISSKFMSCYLFVTCKNFSVYNCFVFREVGPLGQLELLTKEL